MKKGGAWIPTLVAGGVVGVCSDFAVDFDEPLSEDGCDFTLVQGVLEAIPHRQ